MLLFLGIFACKVIVVRHRGPTLRAHLPHYLQPTLYDIRIYQILKSLMSIYEACEALIHMFEGGKILLGYH